MRSMLGNDCVFFTEYDVYERIVRPLGFFWCHA